jgi:hypothetical protein
MQNPSISPLANQHGLAMVLAVSMIALLSTIAVWMILESKSNLQTTKAYERTEATSYLAQSACWFDVRTLDTETPPIKYLGSQLTTVTETTSAPAGKIGTSPVDLGSGRTFTREIKSTNEFWGSVSATGGSCAGYNMLEYNPRYYLGHGTGRMEISATRGSARSKMVNFIEKCVRSY